MGISVITAVKHAEPFKVDRFGNMKTSLQSWYKCPEIDDIIIMDWDSNPVRAYDYLKENDLLRDDLKVIRVVNPNHDFSLSIPLNIAAKNIKEENGVFCKMDVDYEILRDDFFTRLKFDLAPKTFISGAGVPEDMLYETPYENFNWKNLCGFLYITKKDFFSVNGFNEKMYGYGWEDLDLVKRLGYKKLSKLSLDIRSTTKSYIRHIPHYRQENSTSAIDNYFEMNRHCWSNLDKTIDYKLEEAEEGHLLCTLGV